jgi:hypothetical protein
MKITQDVRNYAKEHGFGKDFGVAVEAGMQAKSTEFKQAGAEIYQKE